MRYCEFKLVIRLSMLLMVGFYTTLHGAETPSVDYLRDIKPILTKHCLECHGAKKQSSALRLDQRVSLLKGGDLGAPALVPGKPKESELYRRISSDDAEVRMPKDANALAADEIALLRQWIAEGGNWPGQMHMVAEKATTDLWSMQPLAQPDVPTSQHDNPIDAFLGEALKAHPFPINKGADPRTLIRRVSIVLTGLPPEVARIDSFLRDWEKNAARAYDTLVDELLASDHYGERWAQHWLDVIRWAETTGNESNEFRKNAWPYRDYVVQSFNDDKPYDQFIKEQIAGDFYDVDVATGFMVAGPHAPGPTVGQIPSEIKTARFDRLNEIVTGVGEAMMGITVGCARCHNHKFDPISIKDYYSMVAVFQDVEFDHRLPKLTADNPKAIVGKRINDELTELRTALLALGEWSENWVNHRKFHFKPVKGDAVRLTFKGGFGLDEIQLYSSPDGLDNLAMHEGVKVKTSKRKENVGKPPEYLIDGRLEYHFGWRHNGKDSDGKPWIEMTLPEPVVIGRVELSADRYAHYALDFMQMKVSQGPMPQRIEVRDMLGGWHTVYSAKENDPKKKAAKAKLVKRINILAKEYDKDGPQPIYAGRFIKPVATHLLYRGSVMNPKGVMTPSGPEIIGGNLGLAADSPGQERRVAFANWLASKENPLTARVMANRLWYQVFGTGIVSTPGDFGNAGGKPTHPKLLDWLASDFITNGWSVKTLLRKMVRSEAFQRSSLPATQWLSVDSNSLLLWRFPPRWLEAEVLRDSILQSTGALDHTVGGKGYRIHNIKKRYAQWKIVDNHSDATWRRMLYQERMRRVDDQMFTAFDFPGCGQVQSKRPRSLTPLQALNLLNGQLIVTQMDKLAQRASLEAGDNIEDRVRRMFLITLGREPAQQELEDAVILAKNDSLSAVARVLYNLNEFFYLN